MKNLSILLSCGFSAILFTGCQKAEEPKSAETAETTESTTKSVSPTGLVKAPVRHSEHTADVTKWMDMASTKTPAQIAQLELQEKQQKEAKLAKEAKDAKDAKDARDAKLAKEANDARLAKLVQENRNSAQKNAQKENPASATIAPSVATVAAKPVETPVASTVKSVPSAQDSAESTTLKLVSSVQPTFPKAAIRASITEGVVSARLHIGTDGKVSVVDIIKSKPAKFFDKEVIAAAMLWKYAPVSSPQTKVLEFYFKQDY